MKLDDVKRALTVFIEHVEVARALCVEQPTLPLVRCEPGLVHATRRAAARGLPLRTPKFLPNVIDVRWFEAARARPSELPVHVDDFGVPGTVLVETRRGSRQLGLGLDALSDLEQHAPGG